MNDNAKNIDESWKQTVENEKYEPNDKKEPDFIPQTADFKFFITSLGMQAAVCLGQLENPVTNKKEGNLPQAKLIIDTLDMLKQKTKGNLAKDEEGMLDTLLYELRLNYISNTESKK